MSWYLKLNTGQQLRYSTSDDERTNPIMMANGCYKVDIGDIIRYEKDPADNRFTLIPVNHVQSLLFQPEKVFTKHTRLYYYGSQEGCNQ